VNIGKVGDYSYTIFSGNNVLIIGEKEMNRKAKLIVGVLALVLCFSWSPKADANTDDLKGWKLGMQAYSFNRFTFFEAVDKNKALGMRYIEAYPGQGLSKEKPDAKTDHNMSSQDRCKTEKLRCSVAAKQRGGMPKGLRFRTGDGH